MQIKLFSFLAVLVLAQEIYAKSQDGADTMEPAKPAAPAFTTDAANLPSKDAPDENMRIEDLRSDADHRQPIGQGSKASNSGMSIEDYVMVPVENLEAQLSQRDKRAKDPTGTLKGKYPTLFSGSGASSGEAGDASYADGFEGEDGEDYIEEDDSDDDDGNGNGPEEINL